MRKYDFISALAQETATEGRPFCWSRVDIREILYGYENQLKLDNED